MRVLLVFALILSSAASWAAEDKVPHFASLRASEVNLRAGPGERYPIEWVYQRKGLPVEVTAQFDVWRKIRDSDGTEGWVHERMLMAQRSVIVTGAERALKSDPDRAAPTVAHADPGVVARLIECHAAWCRVETQGIKGWLQRADIWGVYPDETVE